MSEVLAADALGNDGVSRDTAIDGTVGTAHGWPDVFVVSGQHLLGLASFALFRLLVAQVAHVPQQQLPGFALTLVTALASWDCMRPEEGRRRLHQRARHQHR